MEKVRITFRYAGQLPVKVKEASMMDQARQVG